MDYSRESVRPCLPAAPYIGGKSRLAERVISLIDKVPHETYAEVFVGMGGIFLRRHYKPKAEVINDYSRDVSNFFRILQVHYVAFMDMLKWQITTRSEFERLLAVDPDTLTDLQRAARFLYLQRLAFGGKVSGRSFGMDPRKSARFDVTKLGSALEDIHERLSCVTVERLHYHDFIERYDHPECLFYLDPPYYNCEKDYGADLFSREEFTRMAALLGRIEGRFILSINDHESVREIFRDFHMIEETVRYTVGGAEKHGEFQELIITNAHEFFSRGDLFG